MFSDIYIEHMVKKKFDTKDKMICAALATLALVLTFVLFFVSVAVIPALSTIVMLLIVAMWYGCYILICRRMLEFEYLLTNSEMDIDKIIAKRRRKRVMSLDFKEADLIACVKDPAHNRVLETNSKLIVDYSGDSELYDVYFADITVNGERNIVLFRPTEKMLEGIRRFNPRNVFIMNN